MELWNTLFLYPLINGLVFLTQLTGNLGLAIIALTILLRVAMTPLIIPGLQLSKKISELKPEIDKLKAEHGSNKQAFVLAQAALYKEKGISPTAGCLPQILQLVILIALFNALNLLLIPPEGQTIPQALNPILYSFNQLPENFQLSSRFLYLDLLSPDTISLPGLPVPLPGLFLVLSAVAQFISAKMLLPVINKEKQAARTTPPDTDDAMVLAQQQMVYLFPIMTIIFGYQFQSGLVLYWLIFSALAVLQQYQVLGWGGLTPWIKRLNLLK